MSFIQRLLKNTKTPRNIMRFVDAIEATIRLITERPNQWRCFEENVWRCLVSVFPYAVLYSVEED